VAVKDRTFLTHEISYPQWEPEFQAAMVELDGERALERIELAECTIFQRVRTLSKLPEQDEERSALANALSNLRALRKNVRGETSPERTLRMA